MLIISGSMFGFLATASVNAPAGPLDKNLMIRSFGIGAVSVSLGLGLSGSGVSSANSVVPTIDPASLAKVQQSVSTRTFPELKLLATALDLTPEQQSKFEQRLADEIASQSAQALKDKYSPITLPGSGPDLVTGTFYSTIQYDYLKILQDLNFLDENKSRAIAKIREQFKNAKVIDRNDVIKAQEANRKQILAQNIQDLRNVRNLCDAVWRSDSLTKKTNEDVWYIKQNIEKTLSELNELERLYK